MYIVNIAVKWANGELEGFGAGALTKEDAYKRAVKKAHDKARDFILPGFEILNSMEFEALSIEQQDILQNDWDKETL